MANIRYNRRTGEFAWISQTNLDRSVIPSNRCLTSSQADLIYVKIIDYNEDMINIFRAFDDVRLDNIFSVNNNIGINKTNPSYRLDVDGDINFTGQLYKDGALLDLTALSYWDTGNNNDIYRIQGNVGIGEQITDAKLHVESPANLKAGLFTQGGVDSNVSIMSIIDTGNSIRQDLDSAMLILKKNHNSNTRRYLSVGDNNNRYLELLGNGNLGINKGNPNYRVDVGGDINITGDYYKNGEIFDNHWSRLPNDKLIYTSGNVGIGINNPNYTLDVFGDIHLSGRLLVSNIDVLFLWTTDGTNVYNSEAGVNIGIGTNNPNYKLSIVDGGDTITDYKLWVGRDETNKGFGVSLDDFGTYLIFKQTSAEQHYAIFNLDTTSAHDHFYDFRINGTTKVRLGNTSNIDNITINENKLSSSMTDLLINNGNTSSKNFKVFDGQTNQLFTILSNGNVGIGIDNPSTYKLEIDGSINLTDGNSFRINGVPVATVGQTKWSDNSNGIDYSQTNQNVGIQTNTPQDELHVDGTIRAGTNNDYLQITNSTIISTELMTIGTQFSPSNFIGLSTNNNKVFLGDISTPELSLDTANSRVGVGHLNPQYTLDINGDIRYNGDTRTRNTVRKESSTINIPSSGWYTIISNSGMNGRTFMNIKLTSDGGLHEPFYLEFEVFKSWGGSNANNFIRVLNYSGQGAADTIIDKIRFFYDNTTQSLKININAIATLEFEVIATEYLNREFTIASGTLTVDTSSNYLIESDVNSLSLTSATTTQNQNNSSYKISNNGDVAFKTLNIHNGNATFNQSGNALEVRGGDIVFNRENNTLLRFIHGSSNNSKTGNFIRTDGLGRLILGYNNTGQLADDSDAVRISSFGMEMGAINNSTGLNYIVRRNINNVGYNGIIGIDTYNSRTGLLIRNGTNTNLLLDNNGDGYLNNNKLAVENTSNLSNYYTKSNLQTSGDAQIHWDNLTNVPNNIITPPTLQAVTDNGAITSNVLSFNKQFTTNTQHDLFRSRSNAGGSIAWMSQIGDSFTFSRGSSSATSDSDRIRFAFGSTKSIFIGGNEVIHTGNTEDKVVNLKGSTISNLNELIDTSSNYRLRYDRFQGSIQNIFPAVNNANGVISLLTHSGGFGHQLGFSGDGNIYSRYLASNSWRPWNKIWHSGNQPNVRFVGTISNSGILTKRYGDITVTYSNGTFTHNLNTNNYKITINKLGSSRDIPYISSQDTNSCTIFKQSIDSGTTIANANDIEIEIKTF